jgi:hypothetical protein
MQRTRSPGTPASSTTKTGRHGIDESGAKHQKNQKSINQLINHMYFCVISFLVSS